MARKKRTETNLTRQAIIDSASKEFADKGYDNASLRQIVANAKLNTGALYFFFKGKEELFLACLQELFDDVFKIMNSRKKYLRQKGFISEDESMHILHKALALNDKHPDAMRIVCNDLNQGAVKEFKEKLTTLFNEELDYYSPSLTPFTRDTISRVRVHILRQLSDRNARGELSIEEAKTVLMILRHGTSSLNKEEENAY